MFAIQFSIVFRPLHKFKNSSVQHTLRIDQHEVQMTELHVCHQPHTNAIPKASLRPQLPTSSPVLFYSAVGYRCRTPGTGCWSTAAARSSNSGRFVLSQQIETELINKHEHALIGILLIFVSLACDALVAAVNGVLLGTDHP